jgi:hypothetical protein
LYEEYKDSGAQILQPPEAFPWACEMKVGDPDGHVLRFGSDPKHGTCQPQTFPAPSSARQKNPSDSAFPNVHFRVMRQCLALALLVLVLPAPTRAQGYFPIPNQLSLGIGVVDDQQPSQIAPTVVFSFAFADSGNQYWPYRLGLVWEAELGSTSDESCRADVASPGGAATCGAAAFLMGLRFHAFRRQTRRLMPFTSLLLGSYWKGSGVDDDLFGSQHFTLQGGGGIDLRRAGSIHGVRLSVDYRRVFSTNPNPNQLRFVTSYLLGPPEPRPQTGSPAPRP